MKIPVTKERIRVHFTYFWWAYLLLVCAALFGWNLLYNMTRYTPPEDKKVEWYGQFTLSTTAEEKVDALLEDFRLNLIPEMEEVSFTSAGTDETYGAMQLYTWMAAGGGDLYMLEESSFSSFSSDGSFVDLTPYVESGDLDLKGAEIYYGKMVLDSETNETVTYFAGIRADGMTGFKDYGINPEGMILGIRVECGSEEATVKMLNAMIALMTPEAEETP